LIDENLSYTLAGVLEEAAVFMLSGVEEEWCVC
jgi:hypothetical protein